VIKSRKLKWVERVARMGESRGVCRVLVGKPEGRRPLGRPRRRWEDNIKLDLRGSWWGQVAGSLLPHTQLPATCPYREPDRSSPCPHPNSVRSIVIIFSHLCVGLSSGFLTLGFLTKTLYAPLLSPIRATCPRIWGLFSENTESVIWFP
jgi:hypothetical protein